MKQLLELYAWCIGSALLGGALSSYVRERWVRPWSERRSLWKRQQRLCREWGFRLVAADRYTVRLEQLKVDCVTPLSHVDGLEWASETSYLEAGTRACEWLAGHRRALTPAAFTGRALPPRSRKDP